MVKYTREDLNKLPFNKFIKTKGNYSYYDFEGYRVEVDNGRFLREVYLIDDKTGELFGIIANQREAFIPFDGKIISFKGCILKKEKLGVRNNSIIPHLKD